MQWIGMGKMSVVTGGTPVPLSVVTFKVSALVFTYDPADGSTAVYLRDRAGNLMAAVSPQYPLVFTATGSNQIDLRDFQIDAGVGGDGPLVAYGID